MGVGRASGPARDMSVAPADRSNPWLAHGRGASWKTSFGVICPCGSGAAANHVLWLVSNPIAGSPPRTFLGERPVDVEGRLVLHDMVRGPGQLVGHGLDCHDAVRLRPLPFVESLYFWVVADGEVCGLDESPGEIPVAVLDIALPLALPVADPGAAHAAAVGGVIPRPGESRDVSGLQQDGQAEDLADAGDGFEEREEGPVADLGQDGALQDFDLMRQAGEDRQVALDGPSPPGPPWDK